MSDVRVKLYGGPYDGAEACRPETTRLVAGPRAELFIVPDTTGRSATGLAARAASPGHRYLLDVESDGVLIYRDAAMPVEVPGAVMSEWA